VDDLAKLAKLLSGHSIDLTGTMTPVSPNELLDLWREVGAKWSARLGERQSSYIENLKQTAIACEESQYWPGAIKALGQAIAEQGGDWTLHLRRGRALASLGFYRRAILDFERASQGTNVQVLALLSAAQLGAGEIAGRGQTCARLLELGAGYSDPSFIAWVYSVSPFVSPNQEKVVQLARRGIEGENVTGWKFLTMGMALFRAGRYDQALPYLQKAALENSPDAEFVALFLALTRLKTSNLVEGEKARFFQTSTKVEGNSFLPGLRRSPQWEHEVELAAVRREAESEFGAARKQDPTKK